MSFLQLQNVHLAFANRDLLNGVTYALEKGDKAALSGANGSGKTTLLRIMAGLAPPDSGTVFSPKSCRLSYLPQSGILLGSGTVYEEAERAYDFVNPLLAEYEAIGERLSGTEDETEQSKLLARHDEIQEYLSRSDYYRRAEIIETTLKGLGFTTGDQRRPAREFSGGWQMRVALARVLLEKPDLLLMDEPTNYLDLEAKAWLEEFLSRFDGGVLLVSHDRGFLDAIVTEVAEIFLGRLSVYKGNYTAYETRRRQEIEALVEAHRQQQQEFAKAEEYINRFRAKASKASGVQSRIKLLDKVDRIEIPESLVRMEFSFPPAPHSGQMILETRDLGKRYGERRVLGGLDLNVARGEKIVVAGRNGAGKSTLLRILSGEDRGHEGSLRWGTDVRIGYFSQDHETRLDPSLTVLEETEKNAPTALIPKLRGLLGAFLFRGDDVFKKIPMLSGGEKNRLSLVKLLLEPANLLILDEPTNHLDLASKDILLEALKAFDGTVIFVSHDKYFIGQLADKVLELTPAGHRFYPGSYGDYLEKLRADEARLSSDSRSEEEPRTAAATASQRSREESKRRQSQLKKLQKEEETVLTDLEVLEKRWNELQQNLSLPEVYTDGAKTKAARLELDENKARQTALQTRWEELAALISEHEAG